MPIDIQGGTFSDGEVGWWYQEIYFAIKEVEKSDPKLAKQLAAYFAGYVSTVLSDLSSRVYECLRDLKSIEDYHDFSNRWKNISDERCKYPSTGIGSFYSYVQDLEATLISLEANFSAKSQANKIVERSQENLENIVGNAPDEFIDGGNPLTWSDSFSDSLPD